MEQFTLLLIMLTIMSLILIGVLVTISMLSEANAKRIKRRKQRDSNTKHIELNELRLEQIEMRLGMIENQIHRN